MWLGSQLWTCWFFFTLANRALDLRCLSLFAQVFPFYPLFHFILITIHEMGTSIPILQMR